MKYTIIDTIYPFFYLTRKEKDFLVKKCPLLKFTANSIIIKEGNHDPSYPIYLLLTGSVSIIIGQKIIGHVNSPSYFGDRAFLLQSPRQATVRADTDILCISFKSEDLLQFINQNINFRYAFAANLRHKQKIFQSYELFLHSLYSKRLCNDFTIEDLVSDYQALKPVLHPYCKNEAIDFNLLGFIHSRLPDNITRLNSIVLAEDYPDEYPQKLELISRKVSKRFIYKINEGSWLVILRDELTDYIDIITKLCAYFIETKKISSRLHEMRQQIEVLLLENNQLSSQKKKSIFKKLPLNVQEQEGFLHLYGTNWLQRLLEMCSQKTITVRFHTSKLRYFPIAAESWISAINQFANKHCPRILLEDASIHIISSNTHSITNCLSPWIHHQAGKYIQNPGYEELASTTDRHYAAVRQLLNDRPELIVEKHTLEEKFGIYHLAQNDHTGIKASIIELKKLNSHMDPALELNQNNKNSFILNIDYAYGKQSQDIIRQLILLFGTKIKSVSVFGKAGSITAMRGDLMIPENFIIQDNDLSYSIESNDLTLHDFKNLNGHQGTMLTVLGTLMQNHEMLAFYTHFWQVQAIEMEGGYFIQELSRAKIQKLIRPDLITRFAYYISDTPLDNTATLADRLSPAEGIPVIYAITRVMLQKIFDGLPD